MKESTHMKTLDFPVDSALGRLGATRAYERGRVREGTLA